MDRFYFHAHIPGAYLEDAIGIELEDHAQAYNFALQNARCLVSETLNDENRFDLSGWIEVEDQSGAVVVTVPFFEALEVKTRAPN